MIHGSEIQQGLPQSQAGMGTKPRTEVKGPFGMSQKDFRPHPRAAGVRIWRAVCCVPLILAQQELMRDCREGEQGDDAVGRETYLI